MTTISFHSMRWSVLVQIVFETLQTLIQFVPFKPRIGIELMISRFNDYSERVYKPKQNNAELKNIC